MMDGAFGGSAQDGEIEQRTALGAEDGEIGRVFARNEKNLLG
jgi:hypothetical protein